jgi:hypothetical protein
LRIESKEIDMADSDKRLRYYNGQLLQEHDFSAEQEYHLDRQRRHNRQLHTYGIAEGLEVTANVDSATVSPGTAIDGEGRQIVLTEPRNVSFGSLKSQFVLVVISYHEEASDPATVGGDGATRWLERPDVAVIAELGAPPADTHIRLAQLQIDANCRVSAGGTDVRTFAGGRLQRALVSVSFTHNDANGAIRTINVRFQPKFILLIGTARARLGSLDYGGCVGGFWRCDDEGYSYAQCQALVISRQRSDPYVAFHNELLSYFFYAQFTDSSSSTVKVGVNVDSICSTGFKILFSRVDSLTPISEFGLDIALDVIG